MANYKITLTVTASSGASEADMRTHMNAVKHHLESHAEALNYAEGVWNVIHEGWDDAPSHRITFVVDVEAKCNP
jgi:hypothetical protein